MKLDEVLNWKGPAAKMARLEPLLTPDVMAKHHSEMVNIIASKLSVADIDELEAQLSDREQGEDDVEFNLKMIAKALSKYGETNVGTSGNGWRFAQCKVQLATDWRHGATEYELTDVWTNVHYGRGVWLVNLAWPRYSSDKKVKTAPAALEMMKTNIELLLKKYPPSQAGQPIKGKK